MVCVCVSNLAEVLEEQLRRRVGSTPGLTVQRVDDPQEAAEHLRAAGAVALWIIDAEARSADAMLRAVRAERPGLPILLLGDGAAKPADSEENITTVSRGSTDQVVEVVLAKLVELAYSPASSAGEAHHRQLPIPGEAAWSQALFDDALDAILVTRLDDGDDIRAPLIECNDAAVKLTGYSREELLQMALPDLVDPSIDLTARLRSLKANGSLLAESLYVTKDGRRVPVEIHVHTCGLEDATVAIAIARDISGRKRADVHQRVLADASRALAQSIDFETTLANLAELLVPAHAAWCVIDLVDEQGDLQPVVVKHEDPERTETARELRRRYPVRPGDRAGAPRVASTGETELYSEVGDALLRSIASDDEHLRILRTLKPESGAVVPLRVGDRTLGAMTLVSDTPGYYSERDLPLLEELGRRCGVAVEHAKFYREAQREIAERRQAEQAMRSSEERYRLILESATEYAIFTTDLEGHVTSWNSGARRLLGFSEDEIIGTSAVTIFTEADRRVHAWEHEMQRALKVQAAADERWHRRRDGTRFWASGRTMCLRDENNRPQGFLKILRDETKSRQARLQVETRARQQRAVARLGERALAGIDLQELMEDAVTVVARVLDTEMCKVLELMPDGEKLLLRAGVGWQPGLVGQATVGAERESQAGFTLVSDDPVIVEDLHQETRFSGPALLHDHGVVSGMSVIIAGETARPFGVLGTHTTHRRRFTRDDVNFLQAIANILGSAVQRHAVENRLRMLNDTLEQRVIQRTAQLRHMAVQLTQAEERERRRLAEMLHDHLQQLLVASKLQVNVAAQQASAPHLSRRLRRVEELLDESLNISRSLTVELSPPILYEQGLAAGLEWLRRWMREKHELVVDASIDRSAEPEDEDTRVFLFQAAREMLFNVVKHAKVGRARMKLTPSADHAIELLVEDEGRGFDASKPTLSEHSPSGLGLFSLRERVEVLGGQMKIDSRRGAGTRVRLAVPRMGPAPGPASDGEPTAEAAIRVLLVDDHQIVREGFAGVLDNQPGIEVVGQASDGEQAVAEAHRLQPDVVVMDVTMPGINGVVATRRIHLQLPQVRIIGLSVHEHEDMAVAMLSAGAEAYLNKGGPSEELIAAIKGQRAANGA